MYDETRRRTTLSGFSPSWMTIMTFLTRSGDSMPLGWMLRDMSSRWIMLTTLLRFSPIWSIQALGSEMMYVEPPVTCIFLSSSLDFSLDTLQSPTVLYDWNILTLIFTSI